VQDDVVEMTVENSTITAVKMKDMMMRIYDPKSKIPGLDSKPPPPPKKRGPKRSLGLMDWIP
jgi:hypothetical protein